MDWSFLFALQLNMSSCFFVLFVCLCVCPIQMIDIQDLLNLNQTKQILTRLNQTQPNQTKLNQTQLKTKPNLTKVDQTKFNQ